MAGPAGDGQVFHIHIERVIPIATIEPIRSLPAHQRVIARPAGQGVVADSPVHIVVALAAAHGVVAGICVRDIITITGVDLIIPVSAG